mmetsp:Transcript_3532/g.12714  ORF Transcript_3532/g.12714 Transcript_3532/m.12714 type:complete len:306 (+) Transcript_3532:116-1033(+)
MVSGVGQRCHLTRLLVAEPRRYSCVDENRTDVRRCVRNVECIRSWRRTERSATRCVTARPQRSPPTTPSTRGGQDVGPVGRCQRLYAAAEDRTNNALTSQQKTLELVECAMLAACVGLAFTIASQLRLELYISLFYSLPVVIGAIRWGETAAIRIVSTTFLLVFCLSGPYRSLSYLFLHGLTAMVMAMLWFRNTRTWLSIIVCATVRVGGILCSLLLSSWLLRENILMILVSQMQAASQRVFITMSIPFSPSVAVVMAFIFVSLLLNSLLYMWLLHALYSHFLRYLRASRSLVMRSPEWIVGSKS